MTNEITKGQKVTVTGMKTECKFSHYLPVVTWSKKAKPRCVVLVGSGEWEMEVFVSEVSVMPTPDQVEAAHAEAIQINTMMDTAWPLPVSVFIEGCHAEALEMNDGINENSTCGEIFQAMQDCERRMEIADNNGEYLEADAIYNRAKQLCKLRNERLDRLFTKPYWELSVKYGSDCKTWPVSDAQVQELIELEIREEGKRPEWSLSNDIDALHAEALEMDVTYSAIIADRNATLELSRALGRDVLQKSIVMLKCQTVGEVSGEVKEGDTVTVSLQDQNGNKITVTGEVEEILE